MDTLEVKSQSEYLIPVLEVPVYRSSYSYDRDNLVNYLIDKGYWKPNMVDEPRWVSYFRWNNTWRDGESGLCRALTFHGDEWVEWTEAHPEFAQDFWPWVLEELRRNPSGDSILDTMGWIRISHCSRQEYDVTLSVRGLEMGLLPIPPAGNDDN